MNSTDAYAIDYKLNTGSGNYELSEFVYQGTSEEDASAIGRVQEWDHPSKTLKLTNIVGEFSNTSPMIGASSNASYYLSTYDPLEYPQPENGWDNKVIEHEMDNVIDTSENNPFGFL